MKVLLNVRYTPGYPEEVPELELEPEEGELEDDEVKELIDGMKIVVRHFSILVLDRTISLSAIGRREHRYGHGIRTCHTSTRSSGHNYSKTYQKGGSGTAGEGTPNTRGKGLPYSTKPKLRTDALVLHQAEAARTRGTVVTVESFKAWYVA